MKNSNLFFPFPNNLNISLHYFLACLVSEKLDASLIFVPLHVMWFLFFQLLLRFFFMVFDFLWFGCNCFILLFSDLICHLISDINFGRFSIIIVSTIYFVLFLFVPPVTTSIRVQGIPQMHRRVGKANRAESCTGQGEMRQPCTLPACPSVFRPHLSVNYTEEGGQGNQVYAGPRLRALRTPGNKLHSARRQFPWLEQSPSYGSELYFHSKPQAMDLAPCVRGQGH